MGLFDKIKEKHYEKLDREYVDGWNSYMTNDSIINLNMNVKIYFTEQDYKDAEETFQKYLKLKDTPSSTAKEYNLMYAAAHGHEEANRLFRREIFDQKYQENPNRFRYGYWSHLYVCKESFGFKWAVEEFALELEKDLVRVAQIKEQDIPFPKVECKLDSNRIQTLVRVVTNDRESVDARYNAIKEGVNNGYFFNGYEIKVRPLAINLRLGFNGVRLFLDDPIALTKYVIERLSDYDRNDKNLAILESHLRRRYKKSNKAEDASALAYLLLFYDSTPANILEGLSLARIGAKKGIEIALQCLENCIKIVTRQEAMEAYMEVARYNRYQKQADLINVLRVAKEGRLFKECAEFIYEFFTLGGHDKNIKGFIKDNTNLVNFLKEADMKGLGYLQFNYQAEVKFTPKKIEKIDIEAEEYYDELYDKLLNLDPMDYGLSSQASVIFKQVMKNLSKTGLITDLTGGRYYVEFAYRHVTTNKDLCALADVSGAYPNLLADAYKNEMQAVEQMRDRYARIRGTSEDPGSFEAFLDLKGLNWVNDPIEGFKPKCAQELIMKIMDKAHNALKSKYNILLRGNNCSFNVSIVTSQR